MEKIKKIIDQLEKDLEKIRLMGSFNNDFELGYNACLTDLKILSK